MPDPREDATQGPKPLASTASWAQPGRSGSAERIGRFEIMQVLGEGAFGCVYLATDTELGRQVAIKRPHADALTPELRERFLREARATATIHHRNVCPIYDVQPDDGTGRPYIVMHYVVGTTLASLLNKLQTPLPPRHALAIARKLALGMAAAHAKGIIHRDLKPANILYETATREVLITDFGLALMGGESRMTADGAVCGTPAFMSPEQARGKVNEVGPLSDVYALGVILYRMLTGDVPFRGSVFEVMMQHAQAQPQFPSQAYPGLDPRLDAICMKAMAKRPEDRYPSAQALADALTQYLKADGRTDSDAELPFAQAVADETLAHRSHQTARKPLPAARPEGERGRSVGAAPVGGRGRRLAGVLALLVAVGGIGTWFAVNSKPPAAADKSSLSVDNTPGPETSKGLPVAPPPRLKVSDPPKFDAKKLVGKWERLKWKDGTVPQTWEFAKGDKLVWSTSPTTTRTYKVSGDELTVVTDAKSTHSYTIEKLTDDELELSSAKGASAFTLKRVKPKFDPAKLVGKWERHATATTVWVWEFKADDTSARTYGSAKPIDSPYALDDDKLTFTAGTKSQYTVVRLTADELELRTEFGSTYEFRRPRPKFDAKKLVGTWERPLKAKDGMAATMTWEFTRDDKVVWSTSATTVRTYKLTGDHPPCELTVTTGTTTFTYTLDKLTDDELELSSAKGTLMAFKRVRP